MTATLSQSSPALFQLATAQTWASPWEMYRALRGAAATPDLAVHQDAEAAAMAYLDGILARTP